jgi:hypothetical protein
MREREREREREKHDRELKIIFEERDILITFGEPGCDSLSLCLSLICCKCW